MTAATYIYDTAVQIMAAAEAALTPDRTGNPKPNRVNIAWGDPPVDECCESGGQLTVGLSGQGNITGGAIVFDDNGKQSQVSIPRATFAITLYRCVPTPNESESIPPAKVLDASSKTLMSDLWALTKGIQNGLEDGTLYTGASCDNGKINGIETLDPEGGCAGIAVYVTILLNDAGPT